MHSNFYYQTVLHIANINQVKGVTKKLLTIFALKSLKASIETCKVSIRFCNYLSDEKTYTYTCTCMSGKTDRSFIYHTVSNIGTPKKNFKARGYLHESGKK